MRRIVLTMPIKKHWIHGNLREMAYFYNFKVFEDVVAKGGLSVKNGCIIVQDNSLVVISSNKALGVAANGYGNGGGVFVTTSRHDDNLWWEELWGDGGAGNGAAATFEEEGIFSSDSINLSVNNNTANRWGGGLYAGISPPWWYIRNVPGIPNNAKSFVRLINGRVSGNECKTSANTSPYMPSQIAAERVNGAGAILDFCKTRVSGRGTGTDIGLYTYDSIFPVWMGITFSSLATWTLQE